MKKTNKVIESKSKAKRPNKSPKAAKPSKSAVPARAKRDSSVAPKAALPPLPNSKDRQSDMKKTETRVEIKPAKGRPMLTWVGKKPLRHAIAYPAQLVETFHAQSKSRKSESEGGLLFHGDNKDVLAYLLANGYRGKVKLIYIDPPFDSGADYIRKVELRGKVENSKLIDGEGYSLGEQIQYTDIWTKDVYLQVMYERLSLIRELLTDDGSLYLHCDYRKSHHFRNLLDEIFGEENFRNEISWKRSAIATSVKTQWRNSHDTILFYTKTSTPTFNVQYGDYSESSKKHFNQKDEKGVYATVPLLGSGITKSGETGKPWRGIDPSKLGKSGMHWLKKLDELDDLDTKGKIYWPPSGGIPRLKYYEEDAKGVYVPDFWDDINVINSMAFESEGYPTQKPEELLERIIDSATNLNDIVLDCFLGSGTTAATAQKLGRRWIGADINKGAIQTTVKRLQGVMMEQSDLSPQPPLLKGEGEPPEPAQLSFAVYRVNDYDLQIQHNEAFNLAVEHLGMTRSKTDAYFDGTLGKKLVKIVPFNHPVTPLDLEEVKRELNNRPDEERDIVVVGLGKEVAVNGWLEDWNKLRKQGNIPNKIEVIELRSDPKYGGFFTHEPAKAKVSFKRVKDSVEIVIDDFISPTILERLRQQNKDNPLFQPQVTDWRSMVDSVMIDSAYDGKVFNITLADVPEKKNDLVEGKYVLEVKKGASVAVKVTDMLGEEVLVVKEV